MYYLDNIQNCRFIRHSCSISLSEMLKAIRRTPVSSTQDNIAIQAVLELLPGKAGYGPFKFLVTEKGPLSRAVKVKRDGILLIDLEIEGTDVTVNYLAESRENLEELCSIADAQVTLFLKNNKKRGNKNV